MTLTVDIQFHRPAFKLAITHTFPLNGITAIMGPSGCGKTTLLRTIAGLEKPDNGSIRMGDTAWYEDAKHCTPPQHRRLGYVFQETQPVSSPERGCQSQLCPEARAPKKRHNRP